MHEDEYTRHVVDELHVPTEPPQFFAELRERLDDGERRSARRWRRTAFAFALAALAASVTAGIFASTPQAAANDVDRSVQCTDLTHLNGGPFFDVTSQPGSPPPNATGELPKLPEGFKPVPAVQIDTGEAATLLTFSPAVSGYQLDRLRCVPAKLSLSLAPHGLPKAMTLNDGDKVVFHVRCVAPKMLFRVKLTSDPTGIPLRAKLLIVRKSTNRPLAYVDWSRTHVVAYASSACVTMQ